MNAKSNLEIFSVFSPFSRCAGFFVILVGGVALLGWVLNIAHLRSILPQWMPMAPSSAIAFIFSGLALVSLKSGDKPQFMYLSRTCAVIALLLAGLKIVESLFFVKNHIDWFFVENPLFGEAIAWSHADFSHGLTLTRGLNFLLLNVAILLAGVRRFKFYAASQIMAMIPAVSSFMALTAYVYGIAPEFRGWAFMTQMAVNTAINFLALSLGVMFVHPKKWPVCLLSGDTFASLILRRLLPAVVIVNVVLGRLVLEGHERGFYTYQYGFTLLIALLIVVFTPLVCIVALSLYRAERVQRRAEAELRRREEEYRLIQRATNDTIWDWDVPTGQISWNAAVCSMFHYGTEEVGDEIEWWYERIHPEDRERVKRSLVAVFDSRGQIWCDEYRFLCGDGSYVTVIARGFVSYDGTGEPLRMIGALMDISLRKQMETALKESEERFQLVFKGASVGIWDWDILADRIYYNERLARMIGREGEFSTNLQELFDFLHPDDREQVSEALTAHLRDENIPYALELRVRPPSGDYIHVFSRGEAQRDADGKPYRMAGMCTDITDRKRWEQGLEEAKRAAEEANLKKSQFLANISHELRTPLNAIIGYSEMLEGGLGGVINEKQKRYAHNVVVSGKHLLEMVNDILDLSKAEAGKVDLSPEWVPVPPLVSQLREVVAQLGEKNDIGFHIRCQPDLTEIWADPTRLRQILLNLLSNAVKFNRSGGSVELAFSRSEDGQWMLMAVRDTGIGIPEMRLGELFQEFLQLDNSFARQQEGTGLGLVLTKRLVELHGGTISVESEDGAGSVFTVKLPALPPHSREDIQVGGEAAHV